MVGFLSLPHFGVDSDAQIDGNILKMINKSEFWVETVSTELYP